MNQLKYVVNKKKTTIKNLQELTGLLNFFKRAIIPGRTFTRHMYDNIATKDKSGNPLKNHHHINLQGF